jgi:hypothetical protein
MTSRGIMRSFSPRPMALISVTNVTVLSHDLLLRYQGTVRFPAVRFLRTWGR